MAENVADKTDKKTALSWQEIAEINKRRRAWIEEQRSLRRKNYIAMGFDYKKETAQEYVDRHFLEVSPIEFYDSIFKGCLDAEGEFTKGGYTAIATERVPLPNNKFRFKRYTITRDLIELDSLIQTSENFCFMTPISYAGKASKAANARYLFALAIDIDDIVNKNGEPTGMHELVGQIIQQDIPKPTYIVSSGTGFHLYYVFQEPIPLYRNNVLAIKKIRKKLVKKIWNSYVTNSYTEKKIQYESLWQNFRIVGTKTKVGTVCRAYKWGDAEEVTLNYLAAFVVDGKNDSEVKQEVGKLLNKFKEKPNYTFDDLLEKFPDWTERHFDLKTRKALKQPKKKYWQCYPGLYDWFYKRLADEVEVGHRYYSLMCLAGYALKCGIEYDKFEEDCWNLFNCYKEKTSNKANEWTKSDVKAALNCYKHEELIGMSIDSIKSYSGLNIEKNKRNGLTRKQNLEIARTVRDVKEKASGVIKRRNRKDLEVYMWRYRNPDGTKYRCIKETGLSKKTVYKWWDWNPED